MGVSRLAEAALPGYPVAWFAPIHKSITEVWRDALRLLQPVIRRKNETERRIELYGDGVIEFWSLSDPDSARGRKYYRAIVDEAAKARHLEMAWTQVIRPTLADFRGDAYFLSTPRGIDFFHTLYSYGQDPLMTDWASWQMPTSTNPYIHPAEIEAMRSEMPERVFSQEVLAMFLSGMGQVFRNFTACLTAKWQEAAMQGHTYVFGVDWGKFNDYTVITVIDCDTQELCHFERFNKIDYQFQLGKLRDLYDRFKPSMILAEKNSMGEPLIEQLQRGKTVARPDILLASDGKQVWAHHANGQTEGPFNRSFQDGDPSRIPYAAAEVRWGRIFDTQAPYHPFDPRLFGKDGKLWQGGSVLPGLPVYPFNTNNASKTEAIEALALAFEREELQIVSDKTLLAELASFEGQKTKSGLIQYAAPDGLHDDFITSLMIAYQAAAPYKRVTYGPDIWN
jgi:hypothetical protein